MIATTAEAGHSCESPLRPGDGHTDVRAVVSGAGVCLLCVGVHSPSLAAPPLSVIPDLLMSSIAAPLPLDLPHMVGRFALYIRPPPAL